MFRSVLASRGSDGQQGGSAQGLNRMGSGIGGGSGQLESIEGPGPPALGLFVQLGLGATARAETARHGVSASSNRSCFTTPQIIHVNDGAVHTRWCRDIARPTPPCQDPPRAYDPPRRLAARRSLPMTENPPSEARPLENRAVGYRAAGEPLRAPHAEPAGGSPALGASTAPGRASPSPRWRAAIGGLPRHRSERSGGRPHRR